MKQTEAFEILVQALNAATKAGVYSLADTAQINNALISLNPHTEIKVEEV